MTGRGSERERKERLGARTEQNQGPVNPIPPIALTGNDARLTSAGDAVCMGPLALCMNSVEGLWQCQQCVRRDLSCEGSEGPFGRAPRREQSHTRAHVRYKNDVDRSGGRDWCEETRTETRKRSYLRAARVWKMEGGRRRGCARSRLAR